MTHLLSPGLSPLRLSPSSVRFGDASAPSTKSVVFPPPPSPLPPPIAKAKVVAAPSRSTFPTRKGRGNNLLHYLLVGMALTGGYVYGQPLSKIASHWAAAIPLPALPKSAPPTPPVEQVVQTAKSLLSGTRKLAIGAFSLLGIGGVGMLMLKGRNGEHEPPPINNATIGNAVLAARQRRTTERQDETERQNRTEQQAVEQNSSLLRGLWGENKNRLTNNSHSRSKFHEDTGNATASSSSSNTHLNQLTPEQRALALREKLEKLDVIEQIKLLMKSNIPLMGIQINKNDGRTDANFVFDPSDPVFEVRTKAEKERATKALQDIIENPNKNKERLETQDIGTRVIYEPNINWDWLKAKNLLPADFSRSNVEKLKAPTTYVVNFGDGLFPFATPVSGDPTAPRNYTYQSTVGYLWRPSS